MRTVGIDTNVLITSLLGRQPGLNQIKQLFQDCLENKAKIFIPNIVIPESEWVLHSYYKLSKEKIGEFFREILEIDNILIKDKEELIKSLSLYMSTTELSFVDCLVLNAVRNYKIDSFLTFDEDLKDFYNSMTNAVKN